MFYIGLSLTDLSNKFIDSYAVFGHTSEHEQIICLSHGIGIMVYKYSISNFMINNDHGDLFILTYTVIIITLLQVI